MKVDVISFQRLSFGGLEMIQEITTAAGDDGLSIDVFALTMGALGTSVTGEHGLVDTGASVSAGPQ